MSDNSFFEQLTEPYKTFLGRFRLKLHQNELPNFCLLYEEIQPKITDIFLKPNYSDSD